MIVLGQGKTAWSLHRTLEQNDRQDRERGSGEARQDEEADGHPFQPDEANADGDASQVRGRSGEDEP